MIRRAVALASLLLACAPAAAAAQAELNVIPHGQQEPGAAWASAPGMLPPTAQALMYDRLTPLGRNVGDAVLRPSADGAGYFKSAKLLAPDDPSLITDETVSSGALSARIRRDAYGVPHIYSATDDGVIFGAGYVIAADRNLLIDQARDNGIAAAIGIPGVSAIDLVRGLYTYKPTAAVRAEVTRRQEAALKAAGPEGRQVLRDIDTFLAGINLWYGRNRPDARPVDRTDIYATNAIKAQYLGEGGGAEVANALLLDAARDRFGRRRGNAVYEDLRGRNDPETPTTGAVRARWEKQVPAGRARGLVRLEQGSFRSQAPELPGAAATSAAGGSRPQASHALLLSGERSASGAPLFAGGPQISYNYPGLTLEMGLYGPSIRTRGATSIAFPGYMLIGRGTNFAWTLTSAEGDIVDTYAERLCGGSLTRYRYKGRCRRMETVDAGTIEKGGERVAVSFRRTVHGPVTGYARVAGSRRVVALALKRSSYGRETVDQIFFQRLTFGRVRSAADFISASRTTPQTFNAFYASDREIAFSTTGLLPLHRRGVSHDLPVDGRGSNEWRGFLAGARHPQAVNPPDGMLINWNNKPAPGFPASDSRFGQEGPITRDRLLLRELARRPKHTLASLLGAENAASTGDPRTFLWPTVSAVLGAAEPPSPLAAAMAQVLDRWAANDGGWIDADLDGNVDGAGQAVIVAVWDELADAALCGRLGKRVCGLLERLNRRFDEPPGRNEYAGWHNYMDKDLRALLDRPVAGRYRVRYCGNGNVAACARSLWRALESAGRAEAARQGTGDPARWRLPTKTIAFTPLPLVDIQYTNRPSGIHQVMQFAP
jgi:acyl-homoserine lactone acylase PvdQ